MGIGNDKAARRPLRLTAYAASAALGCAALAWPALALAQSAVSNQSVTAAGTANAASTDPTTGPTSASTPATQSTKAASAAATEDDNTALNPRRGLDAIDPETTGTILDDDMRRMNLRESSVDDLRSRQDASREDAQGIALGSFTLRPSVNQSYNIENQRTGDTRDDRTFLQTDLRSTLTSDWSRHALTITGEGIWQHNLSGTGEEEPTANINADLRLDLPADTTAHLTAGYQFFREDTDDPNAIAGAAKQSGVNQFNLGASVERDFGILRGTTAVTLVRSIYSDATLSDGTQVTLSDRDQTAGTWRGRIGYELSPALIPFVEADLGRALYDERQDSNGYERSNHSYGGKAGIEVDLGDKLKGELGLGYQWTEFEDSRLPSINSPTVDGTLAWSPQRGTDVSLGLSTTVDPSTTAGDSGYVAYQLTTGISHQMYDNLIAKVTGGYTWRDYPSTSALSDENVYDAAVGFDWGINRYLDLTTNVGYELTTQKTGDDTHQLRAGVGLTVKR